ncbi:MAG: hypothetical protein ACR2MY_08605 [Candidatus Dormibacteria bacterium]
MRRVILGGLIAAALIWLFDPKQGKARRKRLSRKWAQNKDGVLDAVGTASHLAASATKQVGEMGTVAVNGIGEKVAASR